ncbi:MAG TPA: DUF547 domain-containing protein [Thermoanaerobaculia bacterium]|nr:DUF547 domain-containing protein [Thermoanaerobaculia bacterium]
MRTLAHHLALPAAITAIAAIAAITAITAIDAAMVSPAAAPALAAAAPAPHGSTTAALPDYAAWNQLLARWYDPVRGMDYQDLKAKDGKSLADLRQHLAAVDAAALAPADRLAYWINVYNVNVVGTVVDHYPVASIRDISTDWITHLNVFKKETVPVLGGMTSLDEIENVKIRQGFKDPRIHFAINCAAISCPPIRTEAFTGARVGEQLDDQARRFLNDPRRGVQIESRAGGIVLHVTKVVDWFADDFKQWGGGQVAFIRRYLTPDKQRQIDAAKGNVTLDFYSYDWALNDASPK